jgi:broad specificity phosphatase PhoE
MKGANRTIMRNLSQSTYDRIVESVRDTGDRYPRRISTIDASDLLRAYETAADLLEQLIHTNHDLGGSDFIRDVHAFLKTPTGRIRVELDRADLDDEEIA